MGTRMKVCNAFQMRSKAGTLSAKNSTAKSARLTTITGQVLRRCSVGGRSNTPNRDNKPRVAVVAYRLRPAAKLVVTRSAASSSAGSFTGQVYERGIATGQTEKKKGRVSGPGIG